MVIRSETSASDMQFPRQSVQSRPDSKQGLPTATSGLPPSTSGAPSAVWKQGAPRQSVAPPMARPSMFGGPRSSVFARRRSTVVSQQDDVGVSLQTQLQNIRTSNQQVALENILLEAALHRLTPAGARRPPGVAPTPAAGLAGDVLYRFTGWQDSLHALALGFPPQIASVPEHHGGEAQKGGEAGLPSAPTGNVRWAVHGVAEPAAGAARQRPKLEQQVRGGCTFLRVFTPPASLWRDALPSSGCSAAGLTFHSRAQTTTRWTQELTLREKMQIANNESVRAT